MSAQAYNFNPNKNSFSVSTENLVQSFFNWFLSFIFRKTFKNLNPIQKDLADKDPVFKELMERKSRESYLLDANYYTIECDRDGKINRILWTQSDWEIYERPIISYCRPKKGRSMKALEMLLIEKFVKFVPESVQAQGIKEPAYGVVLMYDMEGNDPLPPEIGVCLQREYEAFGGDPLMCWNGAELEHYFSLMSFYDDLEMQTLCVEYNARIHETGRYNQIVKFYNRLSDCLRELDWGSILTTVEGFDIKANDFECGQIV